jgi:dUTPase
MTTKFVPMSIVSPWATLTGPTESSVQQIEVDVEGKPIVDFQYDPESFKWIMRRGSENALCFDIRSNITFSLRRGYKAKVPTGVSIAMPAHMGCIMRERSGLADRGIRLHAGTLDADYRGEYLVMISFDPMVDQLDHKFYQTEASIPDQFIINRGDRIAQMYFTPEDPSLLRWEIFSLKEKLPPSARGMRGFNSSGQGAFTPPGTMS